ncbi:MAG: hypothetical protein M0P94_04505 [Candidatus Absconditabacterales bacterium]|nr:hypothetical protein [Candidatus Absconditabacterales bacterium]
MTKAEKMFFDLGYRIRKIIKNKITFKREYESFYKEIIFNLKEKTVEDQMVYTLYDEKITVTDSFLFTNERKAIKEYKKELRW